MNQSFHLVMMPYINGLIRADVGKLFDITGSSIQMTGYMNVYVRMEEAATGI